MLLWRLQPLLYCLALPAATVGESTALQMISEAAGAGRSIRDLVTPEEMEKWMNNQWWDAALAAIKLDHEQQPTSGKRTDYFGPPVRKAAREIKARADELVRSLDQNYFKPQRVAPAFQWAQNDTAVFINVKFTRRWNAPGALDIRHPEVNITDSGIQVKAIGEHSGKKHEYILKLGFFDEVDPTLSKWAMASVGKLSATLVKANRRSKWPRLLASKEKKVNNMHYWMDFAEIHEESLKGLPTPKHSLVTCRLVKKAYCLGEDKCVSSCADDCRGKLFTGPDGRCLGKPQEEVSGVNFTDSDPKQGFIGGIVEVNSTATFGDAEFFSIYFLDEDNNKLSDQPILRIENPKSRGTNLSGKIPPSTPIPEEASKITAVPGNLAFGEPDSQRDFAPSSSSLLDLAVPTCTPQKIDLEDTSPEVGQLGGDVKISFSAHAEDSASPTVDYYTLHWGRTANSCERLPGGNSYIVRVRAKGVGEVQHHIGESIAIEKGAESILAFSQHENTDGPHPSKGELTSSCAIWPIRGRSSPSKPPQGLSVLNGQLLANGSRFSGEVIVKRAGRGDEVAAEATAYTLWWCDDDERKLSLLDSPNIEDTTAATDFRLVYEEVEVPEKASKICAFMKNDLGEGRQGAAAAVVSDTARDEL